MALVPHDFQLCISSANSIVNGSNDYFSEALVKVCEELNLPITLYMCAHSNITPSCMATGTEMEDSVDGNILAQIFT